MEITQRVRNAAIVGLTDDKVTTISRRAIATVMGAGTSMANVTEAFADKSFMLTAARLDECFLVAAGRNVPTAKGVYVIDEERHFRRISRDTSPFIERGKYNRFDLLFVPEGIRLKAGEPLVMDARYIIYQTTCPRLYNTDGFIFPLRVAQVRRAVRLELRKKALGELRALIRKRVTPEEIEALAELAR